MKKLFLSITLMLSAVLMSAATYSWTNVVDVKLTDGNSDTYTSRFGEASDLTSTPTWGYAVTNLEGATVRAYTNYNGLNYEKLFLNSLTNMPLTVKTYNSTSLTFELKAYYGTVTLYDVQENASKTVSVSGTATDTYACTVTANSTIEGRFILFYDATAPVATVTTNEEGYATFAYSQNVVAENTTDLTVYAGAINGEELTLSAVNYVKAGEGVVVKGVANTTYNFLLGSGSSDFSANDLIGCPAAATVLAGTNFVLSYQNSVTAFYQYTGTTIPAGKAYLNFPASSPAPKRIRMVINGTTAIDNVEAEAQAEKFVENGQILIKRGEAVYNMQGQIVK